MSLLIAFEGGEACGKSTQARVLADRLGAVLTREPGGTAVGERVRSLLLDPGSGSLDARTEALLMAAARAQHVAEVVAPALAAGRTVVTDRFSHSSLAYQGFGRGLPLGEVRSLSEWATGGRWPDAVILLDLPAEDAERRRGRPDRFEAESREFHRRVEDGFRTLAGADPERWRVVDASGSIESVAARVWSALADVVGSELARPPSTSVPSTETGS